MLKKLIIVAGLIGTAGIATAGPYIGLGGGDVSTGALCHVKGKNVIVKDKVDCATMGGQVAG